MSKLHTQGYGDLFYNEMCALGRAEVHNIPRVIKYVQPAKSEDDICLILECAWLHSACCLTSCIQPVRCTYQCLHLHANVIKTIFSAGWCVGGL